MAHPRKLIRDAMIAALRNATPAGPRVTNTEVDPTRIQGLPALSVYTPSDPTDDNISTSQELWRNLDIEVVAWVVHSDASPAVDQMDGIAETVEAIFDADRFLGSAPGVVGGQGLALTNTEAVVISEINGQRLAQKIGLLKMTYTAPYLTSRVVQGTLADFRTAATTTQVTGATVDNAAQDVIAIPT